MKNKNYLWHFVLYVITKIYRSVLKKRGRGELRQKLSTWYLYMYYHKKRIDVLVGKTYMMQLFAISSVNVFYGLSQFLYSSNMKLT